MKFKKLFVMVMITAFLAQSLMLPAVASTITDGGNNPLPSNPGGTGNIYDIYAQWKSGTTGFHNFTDFILNNPDVANFLYEQSGSGDYDKFVALIQNPAQINGIINTMANGGGFFPGHLIFVAPGGLIIGSSGVLNVGSFTAITPISSADSEFKKYWNAVEASEPIDDASVISTLKGQIDSAKTVDIQNGARIFTRNDVDIAAGSVNIASGGSILTGVENGLEYDAAHLTAFDNLVSTTVRAAGDGSGNGFNVSDGKVIITADKNVTIGGKINSAGLDVTAINTSGSSINVANTANLITYGDINFINNGGWGINVLTALVSQTGGVTIEQNNSELSVITDAITAATGITLSSIGWSGSVQTGALTTTDGAISITHSGGLGGVEIASINANTSGVNSRDVSITSGGSIVIAGATTNTKGDISLNSGDGILIGNVTANNGALSLINNGLGGISTGNVTANNGALSLINNGLGSITAGILESTAGNVTLYNAGNVIIQGTVTAATGGTINITGSGLSTSGALNLTATGGTVNLNVGSQITANSGITINAATLASTGTINLSSTGSTNITGAINAATGITINAGALTIGGNAQTTTSGDIALTSASGMDVRGLTSAGGVTLNNTTTGGITTNGNAVIAGSGNISITNQAAVTASINTGNLTATSGSVSVVNNGISTADGGVEIGNVTANSGITLTSNGAKSAGNMGLKAGNLINRTSGTINVTNNRGNVEIASIGDTTSAGAVTITNNNTNSGTTTITGASQTTGSFTVNSRNGISAGAITTRGAGNSITLNNIATGIINTGTLNSAGTVAIDNRVAGGNITVTGDIQATGDIAINRAGVITNGGLVNITGTTSGANILIDSVNGITLGGAATSTGNLTLSNFTNASNISTRGLSAGGTLTIVNAVGNIDTNSQAISGANGVIIAGNAAGTAASGGTVSTGTIGSSAGKVTIKGGGAVGTSTITANSGIDVSATGGGVTIGGGVSQTTTGNIDIVSVGDISIQGLTASAGHIELNNTNFDTITVAGAINAATGIDITTGVLNSTGNLVLNNSTSDNITINGAITAATDVTITNNGTGAGSISTGNIKTANGTINLTNMGTGILETGKLEATIGKVELFNIGVLSIEGEIKATTGIDITGLSLATTSGALDLRTGTGIINLNVTNPIATTAGINIAASGLESTGAIVLNNSGSGNILIDGAIEAVTGITINNTATNGAVTINGLADVTGAGNISISSVNGKITTQAVETSDGAITVTTTGAGDIEIASINANKSVPAANKTVTLQTTGTAGNIVVAGNISNKKGDIKINSKGSASLTTADATAGIKADSVSGFSATGLLQSSAGNIEITNTTSGKVSTANLTATTGSVSVINDGTGVAGTPDLKVGTVTAGTDIVLTNSGANGLTTSALTNTNGIINVTNTAGNVLIASIDANTGSTPTSKDVTITNGSLNSGTTTITGTARNRKGNITINSRGLLQVNNTITADDGNISLTSADGINTRALTATIGSVTLINNTAGAITTNGNTVTAGTNISITNNANVTTGTITTGQLTNKDGTIDVTAVAGNILIDSIAANTAATTGGAVTLKTTTSGDITVTNTLSNLMGEIIVNSKGSVSIGDTIVGTDNVEITNETGDLLLASVETNDGDITLTNNSTNGRTQVTNFIKNAKGDITVTNTKTASTTITIGTIDTNEGAIDIDNKGTGLTKVGAIRNKKGSVSIASAGGGVETSTITANEDVGAGTGDDVTIINTGTGAGKIEIKGVITNTKGDVIIDNQSNNASAGVVITEAINALTDDIYIYNHGAAGITTMAAGIITANRGNITIENIGTSSGAIDINGAINANSDLIPTKTITVKSAGTGGINIKSAITNYLGNIIVNSNYGAVGAPNSSINVTSTGSVLAKNGVITLQNTGEAGINIAGIIKNENGNIALQNNANNSIASKINITGTVSSDKSNGTPTVDGILTDGVTITNNAVSGIDIGASGIVENINGKVTLNNTNGGIEVKGKVRTTTGDIAITNSGAGKINIAKDAAAIPAYIGEVLTGNGSITITNNGTNAAGDINDNATLSGINIDGNVIATLGAVNVTNNGANAVITGGGQIEGNSAGDVIVRNVAAGLKGINFTGIVRNKNANVIVENLNTSATSGIIIGSVEANETGGIKLLKLFNKGGKGIEIVGDIYNHNGGITLENDISTSTDAKIQVTHGGSVVAEKGDIIIDNTKTLGNIIIQDIVETLEGDIFVKNNKGDTIIGYALDNDTIYNSATQTHEVNPLAAAADKYYLRANKNNSNGGNIIITKIDGNLLNAGVDRTLIHADGDLNITVTGGNIGDAQASRDLGLVAGSSAAGTTRGERPASGFETNPPAGVTSVGLYTETINVHVKGDITANATNTATYNDGVNPTYSGSIINLRSKNSDMNVKSIVGDYIMLTAADWVMSDDITYHGNDPHYLDGYSIKNVDNTGAQIQGKHISIIASDTVGNTPETDMIGIHAGESLTIEAEKNVYYRNLNTAVSPKIFAKTGDAYVKTNYDGTPATEDAFIDEIIAGGNVTVVHLGKTLTIYNLGITDGLQDDLLFRHDGTGCGIPETINISVLDINGGDSSKSVLTIYNARVRGAVNPTPGVADVTLIADIIIANNENAPASTVNTQNHPNGYDPRTTRADADAMWANEIEQYLISQGKTMADREATGFQLSGGGREVTFDVRGVDPDLVQNIIDSYIDPGTGINPLDTIITNRRTNFNLLDLPVDQGIFANPYFDPSVDHYGAETVYLSSDSMTPSNRGVIFNRLYAGDAYIDSKDLNFSILDAAIEHYGEFRNGNKGGTGGYSGDYRWTTIVDNDYKRHLRNQVPLTIQLYSKLTGSFYLDMGNLISIKTTAPTVFYNPYEVRNLARNENSFSRLTFKDDKIQELTTTAEFDEVDKDTYKPHGRNSLRFEVEDSSAIILVNDRTKDRNKLVKILDLSKGGLAIPQDGNFMTGDNLRIKLTYGGMEAIVNAVVVRADVTTVGVRFIDMDDATANKILFMNMLISSK